MASEAATSIDAMAAAWVARMDAADWSAEDEGKLEDWLSSDVRHRGALLHAQALWLHMAPPVAEPPAEDGETPIRAIDRHRRALIMGGGAALAASLVGGIALLRTRPTIRTEVGEIRRMPLPDGSVAEINTASELKIAYADRRREIDLRRGEAWFQVSSNPQRPFVVKAGPVMVRAVGTAFSVRKREDGAEILVTEGIVQAWTDGHDGSGLRLTAGDKAYLSNDARVRQEATASIDHALAWRDGRIDLQGETVSAAIAEFNRYNRRQLTLDDPSLANERLDGFFRTDDVEGFARSLRVTLDVPITIQPDGGIRIGSSATAAL